ncbi:LysR family transcriptional regulator [Sphingomonas sp.]|uniref:LysR family transcriptional regulator n=1 Tax=Sphingomonas sp. TaxID=28214 RepID=UPI000DB25DE8|nr:LysR family transcriptional regulator [Sphingomonas sp.]PZU10980.1 MAG: hypothetical protein DI605_05075 [Sphingomonas sp.]
MASNPRRTGAALDIERWKLFLLIAEVGSLSRAAVMLSRPQPVISRQIAALEIACQCTLFYRTGRGLKLTETGEAIRDRVRALVTEADQLLVDLKSRGGLPVGNVSLGLLPSVPIAADLTRMVARDHPGIDLHLTEASGGQLGEQVAAGRIDLALVLREPGMLQSKDEALLRLPMCFVTPPDDPLASAAGVTLETIGSRRLLMAKPPNAPRMLVDQAARKAGVQLNFGMDVDQLATQRTLVAAGLGCTIATRGAVREAAALGNVGAVEIVEPALEIILALARSTQRPPTLAIRTIARLVSDLVRRLPDRWPGDSRPAFLPYIEP